MLNINRDNRKKVAAKDLSIKLSLEAALYRQIQPIFSSYSDQYRSLLESHSIIPPIDDLQKQFETTLSNHYSRVADKFSTRIASELGIPDNHDDILKQIQQQTGTHHASRSQQSASIIAQTTQDDASRALVETQQQASDQGKFLSKKELAAAAALRLRQLSVGRLNTIAATETQNPAEQAKQTEFESLSDFQYQGIHERTKQKEWVAILDNVTRADHAEADGQIVVFDEPYIVGGQKLMFPGDMSLGATIDNVINCRCSSVPIIR